METNLTGMLAAHEGSAPAISAPGRPALSFAALRALADRTLASLNAQGIGRNDRVVVDRYDDPRVNGVSCYVSRAETGGLAGSLGLATDPNRYSIACRATGPVTLPEGGLPKNEIVFGEKMSVFFKEIRVTRMYDPDKRVIVYLVWSTISMGTGGAAFNSVTSVPLDAR